MTFPERVRRWYTNTKAKMTPANTSTPATLPMMMMGTGEGGGSEHNDDPDAVRCVGLARRVACGAQDPSSGAATGSRRWQRATPSRVSTSIHVNLYRGRALAYPPV